jgi:hypothetical protein
MILKVNAPAPPAIPAMRGTLVAEFVKPPGKEVVACEEGLTIVEEDVERASVLMPERCVLGATIFVGPSDVEIDELVSGLEAVV